MVKPVLFSDGFHYEKYHIERWVANGAKISPKTGVGLQDTRSMEDATMRIRIQEFMEKVKKDFEPHSVSGDRGAAFYLPAAKQQKKN